MTLSEEMDGVCLRAEGVEAELDSLKRYAVKTFGASSRMSNYLQNIIDDTEDLIKAAEAFQTKVDNLKTEP